MQTLDVVEDTGKVPDDNMDGCSLAYQRLNRALFGILAKPLSTDPYTVLLEDIKDIIPVQVGAIYHFANSAAKVNLIACSGDISSYEPIILDYCRTHIGDTDKPSLWHNNIKHPRLLIKTSRINTRSDTEFTLLVLICSNAKQLKLLHANVIEILAQGFADVFSATRHQQANRQRVMQEERAAISRELHDSLAQSLTYLKIQASRIQAILVPKKYDETEAKQVVLELRNNLNIAYRQLRELMTTFRLTMNGENLTQALEETIAEFEKRTSIAFELDTRLTSDELSTDEEMQVLHIIREALSNIVRHSHAQRAKVVLRHLDENIEVIIEDNGIGIDNRQRRAQHHGLIIMQERCHNLGGEFNVEELETGGTRVITTFKPVNTDNRPTTSLRHE
jgi:nitrate/nitrite-specific signal transduction histidine kinase